MNKKFKIFTLFLTVVFFFSSSVGPVLAAVSYTYDANGNMTSNGTNCYEYNEANQVKKVKKCSNNETIAEYVYDHNGNRVVKKVFENGTLKNTVFSPSDDFETDKLASNGATKNTAYYSVNNELVAKKNPDGTKNYYHNDHLGSTSTLTNQTGSLVEETKYDPWGEIKSGGTESKFLYTGQEHDVETGLDYYNARYYNSHIRRFTQPDTFIANIYNPQDLNVYSYVLNNPLRYTDPTGHYAETVADVAFLAMDVNEIRKDPTNAWNYAALGADAVGAAIPVGTGFGLGVRAVQNGGDVGKAAASYTKAVQGTSKNAQNVVKQSTQNNPVSIGGSAKPLINKNNNNKVAGKITGYTQHGLNQAISRDNGKGVAASAILNAVRNPQSVVKQAQGTVKYVGKQATVVLNKIGKIVTTWGKPRKR